MSCGSSCNNHGNGRITRLDGGKASEEQMLDVIGSHRELMVIGHVNVIKFLPFVHRHNLHLLEQFYNEPANYSGRPAPFAMATAKVTNYGNDYLALTLFDDMTRPEIGEFLLNRGWEMIGYSCTRTDDQVYIMEKWSSKPAV